MADQYTMNWSDGTSFIVQPRTQDTTSSSLTIYGKGMRNYGEGIQENILHILENFANNNPPANATVGQLWFNTADNVLYIFKAGSWVTTGTDPTFIAVVNAHINDTVAHLTATEHDMLTGLVNSGVTPGELIYLAGLSSNIQNQLDTNAAAIATNTGNIATNTADIATKVNRAGDTMTGALSMGGYAIHDLLAPVIGTDASNKASVDLAIFDAFKTLSFSDPGVALYQNRYEVYATSGQTVFGLPWSYVPASGDLSVYVNGIRQIQPAYAESSPTVVTFSTGLQASDEVMFGKFVFGGGLNPPSTNGIASVTQSTQTAPGGTAVFTVPSYVLGTNTLMVWVNGVKQTEGVGYAFTETNTTTITFAQNLNIGDVLYVEVLNLMNASTGPSQTWPTYSEVYREILVATTTGQTSFALSTPYHHSAVVGDVDNAGIDVYIAGVFQGSDEISETNGSSFVLAGGVPLGTVLEFYAYKLS